MENQTNTQAQQRRAAAATAQSDEISQRLYNLTQIVALAAFAAEARRTLAEIDNTLHYRPELKDNTGEVLHYVARQLEIVNGDFTENLYDLAHSSGGLAEPEKIGGED